MAQLHFQDDDSLVMPNVVTFLSSLLQRVVESNDIVSEPQKISVFHGLCRPTISIQTYLKRIFKYANCSSSCFVVAYIYLDRFMQSQAQASTLLIDSLSVHRLLITSVLVSAKFMDDISYNNAYYAKVGGISTREMNILEMDFLFGLSFQLNVTPNTFSTYCSHLQKEIMLISPPRLPQSIVKLERPQFCYNEEDCTHQAQLAA